MVAGFYVNESSDESDILLVDESLGGSCSLLMSRQQILCFLVFFVNRDTPLEVDSELLHSHLSYLFERTLPTVAVFEYCRRR